MEYVHHTSRLVQSILELETSTRSPRSYSTEAPGNSAASVLLAPLLPPASASMLGKRSRTAARRATNMPWMIHQSASTEPPPLFKKQRATSALLAALTSNAEEETHAERPAPTSSASPVTASTTTGIETATGTTRLFRMNAISTSRVKNDTRSGLSDRRQQAPKTPRQLAIAKIWHTSMAIMKTLITCTGSKECTKERHVCILLWCDCRRGCIT
mmetsp:Transcript_49681/g.116342  ORF Transcript_49681/g.116342 Transcript_49681/m.116342 type:complete len:214 (+) Transcript_49681:1771-2412(+)